MTKLVLLRHGESSYNQEDRFAGWADVDLSRRGVNQAKRAGRILKKLNYHFDAAYTSLLKRTIRTLWIVLDTMDLMWIPVYHSWRLNERHYGALQGLSRAEAANRFGEETINLSRHNYFFRPPPVDGDDVSYSVNDARYAELPKGDIPLSESLQDAVTRLLPYWHSAVTPAIRSGKKILIVGHGDLFRSLIKYLDDTSTKEIAATSVLPTGIPLICELGQDLKPVNRYYLMRPARQVRQSNGP